VKHPLWREDRFVSYELSSVHVAPIAWYWKFFLLQYIQALCQSRLLKADQPVLFTLCYNGSLVTWTVVSLTAAKFKPLIFSVSGFVLPCAANIVILMILYDLCMLPVQFCYIIVHIRKVENRRLVSSLYSPGTERIETTDSNSSSIVACVSVAADKCLSSCYQAMAVFFSHHFTLLWFFCWCWT
jgi:hypothetical protein